MTPAARVVAALAVAGATLRAARAPQPVAVDVAVADALGRPRGATLDRVVAVLTDLGSVYGLAGTAATLTAAGRREQAADVAAAGLVAWGTAQGAKRLVERARPYQAVGAARLVSEPAGTSWPSGHTAVVAAMGAALRPSLTRRGAVRATTATAAVGASRCYVGVHWASDVVAGAAVGEACAAITGAALARLRRRPGRSRAGG